MEERQVSCNSQHRQGWGAACSLSMAITSLQLFKHENQRPVWPSHRAVCGQAVTYEEAEVTILCKKIYWQDMDAEHMPEDVVKMHYSVEEPHRLFIGEVLEIM